MENRVDVFTFRKRLRNFKCCLCSMNVDALTWCCPACWSMIKEDARVVPNGRGFSDDNFVTAIINAYYNTVAIRELEEAMSKTGGST